MEKQNTLILWLAETRDGLTIRDVSDVLSITRQSALYHVKKMAATSQLVLVLEPCVENRGLRYRAWDEEHLARRLMNRMPHKGQVAA